MKDALARKWISGIVVGSGFMPTIGGTMTGQLLGAVGTAGAPGFSFAADANTGMWSPSGDVIAWSTGGSEGMRLRSNGKLALGGGTYSSDDSALLINRNLSGSSPGGFHDIRLEGTVSFSGAGFYGYGLIDAIPTITGSGSLNHVNVFQSRPQLTGTFDIDQVASLSHQVTHNGTGTVAQMVGLRLSKKLGTGSVTAHYGVLADADFDGLPFWSANPAATSYHAGPFVYGTAPRLQVTGFTTYGAVLSHDATGNLLTNPNLTIINGVITMASSTAKVLATGASNNLQLDAATGRAVESLKPLKLPSYTVATLPTASSYTNSRAMVSDANATTFASIVAGGGANVVPVYSDGTDWRIG